MPRLLPGADEGAWPAAAADAEGAQTVLATVAQNSVTAPKKRRRGPGRPFQKGQSGNPGGRPKESDEVKTLARQHTVTAVERLAFWMGSDNAKASVSACSALLDRGWGKPAQAVTGVDGAPLIPPNVTILIQPQAGASNRT